jgi:hypothetical protein
MTYIIRLNPRAINPLTHKVIPSRLWEIEQCESTGRSGRMDSEKVIWHAADVRIDGRPIHTIFTLPAPGGEPWSTTCHGIVVRGYDDAIEIKTGVHDASGN